MGKLIIEWCPQCNKPREVEIQAGGYMRVCQACRFEWLETPDKKDRLMGGKPMQINKLNHITGG